MFSQSMLRNEPESLVRHLHDLGHHVGDVGGRVRLAIADAIKATVADIARDAIDRLLARLGNSPSVPSHYRWCLRQQGTSLSGLGIALVTTAAAALTRRLAWGGLPVVEAAGGLFNLRRFLAVFVALLARA